MNRAANLNGRRRHSTPTCSWPLILQTARRFAGTLKGIAQRIDTRLGEVQANIDGVQADITALQVRLDRRKSRLLFVFNLVALLSTLMLAWIIYTQVVVIQHHWARVRPPRPNRRPATTS